MVEQSTLEGDWRGPLDMKKDAYPLGCLKVLIALERGDYNNGYEWVTIDELIKRSGQVSFGRRIWELRKKHGFKIVWNQRGGRHSAYKLLTSIEGRGLSYKETPAEDCVGCGRRKLSNDMRGPAQVCYRCIRSDWVRDFYQPEAGT